MLYTIQESIGIDAVIERIKADLYSRLEAHFPQARIDGFGRVHRNRKEDGMLPEYRIGNEYRDVYLDDRKDLMFSFLPEESSISTDEFVFTNEVQILFFCNLKKLYGSYLDEKVHRDVVSILRDVSGRNYMITGVEVGLDRVLSDFNTHKLEHTDIAPFHFFSVQTEMYFNLNDSCNG